MEKLKMHSINKVDENVEKIGKLFPNCLTERINEDGKLEQAIDFEILKQELSKVVVEGNEERYRFEWPDKKKSILLANAPISKTLRPCKEESVDFENTENLYIEGDNLDVLKLLQETYLGKVKMIYIDPPYNTGKDSFIYNDNYTTDMESFAESSGQYDEDKNLLFDMKKNMESNGRFHTEWINMIYPRIKIARDLLKEDGIIFISIDEKEVNNLTKICDEIFGVTNHLETFHIQVRYANKSLNEDNDFQPVMEYILVYSKDKNIFKPKKPSEPYDLSKFCYSFEELTEGKTLQIGNKTVTIFTANEWKVQKHDTGKIGLLKETWASGSIVRQSGTAAEFLAKYLIDRKPIDGLGVLYKIHNMGEDGLGYRYVTGPLKEEAIRGKFYSGVPLERIEELKNGISLKYKPITNYYDYSPDFGNISHEGKISFNSGKKPLKMLKNLLFTANLRENDIVMDFFSGSASFGHAVTQYNIENHKNINYILVQIPEKIDEKDSLFKSGYTDICKVGLKRLRNIYEENKAINKYDLGFRFLKLDSSNMKDVYYNPSEYKMDLFETLKDNIEKGRTPEDLLFQVMLDLGVLLSSKIEEKIIGDKKVFNVAEGFLIACFDKNITEETIRAIAEEKPYYFVMRDSSMANDSVATNFEQIFATYSPDTIKKVL